MSAGASRAHTSGEVPVEALGDRGCAQWAGDNLEEIEAFGVKFRYTVVWEDPLKILAGKDGAQEYVPCPIGHWIVRQPGDLSDHWPVEDSYFKGKYEPVG